jgi:glycosyltransferase-like protein
MMSMSMSISMQSRRPRSMNEIAPLAMQPTEPMQAMQAMQPLAIAILTHSVNPRGGVVHALQLAEALQDAGHRVTLLAPATPGQTLFREPRCDFETVPCAANPGDIAQMVEQRVAAYERHLSHSRFDAIDIWHAQDSISGNALANLADTGRIAGYIRTVHHLDRFDDPRLEAYQYRGFAKARSLFCVSRLWQKHLLERYQRAADLVGNGVDTQRFNPVSEPRDRALAERHGLTTVTANATATANPCASHSDDGPLILAVGGIEPRKNTYRLIEAFIELRRRRPTARLALVGGASVLDHRDYFNACKSLIEAHRLDSGPRPALLITGAVPDADMPAWFRLAQVLAMPSLNEGFGLVVLEALASGTAVVVSKIAPFTEYLDERHCHFADPLDSVAIARALEQALDRGKESSAYSRANSSADSSADSTRANPRAELCNRFSWPASAGRHVTLYRRSQSTFRETSPCLP